MTIDRTTTSERAPSPPVRLSLTPVSPVPGLLDGAWWPRSRDLTRELPPLTAVLDPLWGRITHVTVNPAHWPVIPHKVPVAGHTVHVGWFTDEQDPHELLLLSYTVGRWDLLVIPPETAAAAAARLMAAAAMAGGLRTASQLMADEVATGDGIDAGGREAVDGVAARSREEAWETDGGAAPTSPVPRHTGSPGRMPSGQGM
ncbi:DUF5994 family protein [Streptomyces sp. V3I7]|uniref:DUF5994 family protein n=1 Tax=Streptomyces sp. V3I7 TaxID=3042278 RepID=UPI002785A0A4|nr:DUF5994 family protein [Streptomyces sp. V3I7]MDQ0991996.1 hypothetical protein [Streptomyces sp. V3I7]